MTTAGPAAAAGPADPQRPELSPRLVALAKNSGASDRAQANAVGLPLEGAGSLLEHDGRPVVEIRVPGHPGDRIDALKAAGARVLHVSDQHDTITAAVAPGRLRSVASVKGVRALTEVLTPMQSAACPSGDEVSEGNVQLNGLVARGRFGLTGAGVTVGVLSDTYDMNTTDATSASSDVANGELPGTSNPCGHPTAVNVLEDFVTTNPLDEGRAMAQIVHDIAPGARLAFATAFSGELAFADNIRDLKDAGAKVIVDDVTYFDEPVFQDGPVAVAVSDVTAAGVTYFSSAANNNLIRSGRDVASWETPSFRNAGSCPAGIPSYANQCLDFNPGSAVDTTYSISVAGGTRLLLAVQWAQPWNGVTTDLDMYLRSSSGTVVAQSENANVASTQKPFEIVQIRNTGSSAQTVTLSINRYTGSGGGNAAAPRVKLMFLQNGLTGAFPTEYTSSSGGDIVGPTIFGHNGTANAVSAAAVPYNNFNTVETYSSRGPVTLRFGPVTGGAAASPLPSPIVLAKPDLAATDCGATSFFSSFDGTNWRFCGTSAAAPHAAGIAALALQARPATSVTALKAALRGSGRPVGSFPATAVGTGLVDAHAAVAWLKALTAGLVRNINPSSGASSSPANFAVIGSTLYFTANDGTHGTELYKSNGTAAGTVLVKDINPAAGVGSSPTSLTAVGSTLYFAADNGTNGRELYKSDGTAAGTVLVKDIRPGSAGSSPARLNAVGGILYFAANDGVRGSELYRSSGTATGTALVSDLNPIGSAGSSPQSLTTVGTTLYFIANDGTNGFELFKSNGLGSGTVMVKDINPAAGASSTPSNLTAVGSLLYFSADDGSHGRELFRSNGTSAGTLLVSDINPSGSSSPGSLTRVGSSVFFSASDGAHGIELFKSNGSAAGTVLVADIVAGAGSSAPSSLAVVGTGTVYFAATGPSGGVELFRSNGTASSTKLFKDINPSGSSFPAQLTNLNGTLIFTANNGVHGTELWRSEGTSALTAMIRDVNPGSASSFPAQIKPSGLNTVFYAANDGVNGVELWRARR